MLAPCVAWIMLLALTGCREDPDLTRALDAGIGRAITTPPAVGRMDWLDLREAATGNDTLVFWPVSLCWRGAELAVADEAAQRVLVFSELGAYQRSFGGRGVEPGRFLGLGVVRCSEGAASYLAADAENKRVTLHDREGAVLGFAAAPFSPQVNILGDFALTSDGRWFDAWLGPSIPFGPYLTDAEWEGVRLVRGWAPDGAKLDSFGMPAVFADPVARRVFNHVSLAFARDTLWVLTRGTASIQGFTIGGQPTGAPLYLPVYHRGMEPRVELGDVNPVTGFRPNELTYHPNVGGVAVGRDSLFVLVRYSRWRLALLGRGWDRWLDYWPTSWIELVDRRGSVVSALEVPGYPIAIATDGEERVAIITDEKDGTRRVLIGRLP